MDINHWIHSNCGKSWMHYILCRCMYEIWLWKNYRRFSPEEVTRRKFVRNFGRDLNLENPQTLNEKIQWLKLNAYIPLHTKLADKYAMKEWIAENFGEQYNVPVIFHTSNWRDINKAHIQQFPCIVKANHSSHDYVILRNMENVNWKKLRRMCRFWLKRDYYMESQERQYKDIERQIVVEQLLQTYEGKIPNDYKLNYINGELQYVYVAVDREERNVRCIYDSEWNKLPFDWSSNKETKYVPSGVDVKCPSTFGEMKRIASKIAELFKYVRVDFYDVNGKLYVGEITLHHGGGFDKFRPQEYDTIFGQKLRLEE